VTDVLALPFDQYQRYRLVADLLGELRDGGEPLEVLDVGGRTALLRSFLADDRITLVDLEESAEPGLILGDGSRLPFRDRAFDVVCAFDTLEHVPPVAREAFVAECRRVARRWVVLAGPYHTAQVARAEKLLARFMKDKLGLVHRYLNEHSEHGLPVRRDVERQLGALGGTVESFGHGNLDRWLVLMCLSMYMDDDPALRKLAKSFHRFYNRSLYASDHTAPVYRHVVVAAFEGAALPDAARHLAPAGAPRDTLKPFKELTTSLLAFDQERERWRAERERLREVVGDLDRDLTGSRGSILDLVRELDQTRELAARERAEAEQVRTVLEADLAQHAASLADLERDLEAVRAAAARDRDAGREARATLEADLAEHERTLAAQAETLRAEQRAGAEQRAVLEADLAEHRRTLEQRERELAAGLEDARRARQESAEQREVLQADLTQHALTLEELRGELAAVRADAELVQQAAAAQREALETELARHHSVVAGVRHELEAAVDEVRGLSAEGAARKADLERELERELEAEHERVISLDEHADAVRVAAQAALADLRDSNLLLETTRAELELVRDEFHKRLAEQDRVREDLAADLAGHVETLAALRQVVDEKDRGIAAVEGELRRVEGISTELQDQLRASLVNAAELGSTLERQAAEIETLRAALRNRWGNFARAFTPGKPEL